MAERAPEELYAESVRRYQERRRKESRAAWASYHLNQAARLEATAAELAAFHRAQALALEESGDA